MSFLDSKVKKGIMIGVTCLVTVIVILIAATGIYFHNRWGLHTTLNQIDVSKMTYAETQKMMAQYTSDYQLEITGRDGGKLQLTREDIEVNIAYGNALDQIIAIDKKKNVFSKMVPHTYEQEFPVAFSKEKLIAILKNAPILVGDSSYAIHKPKNAYVTYNDTKKAGEIVPEELGNQLLLEPTVAVIADAIEHAMQKIDLSEKTYADQVYKKPKFYSTDDVLQTQLEQFNQYVLTWITWTSEEGITFSLTPEEIKDWLHPTKKGKVKLDQTALKQWIEERCLEYKTQGKTRTFTTHDKRKIKVAGGDYGWRIDYDNTVQQALKRIQKKKDLTAIEAYLADPSEENQKALTKEVKINFSNKGYVWNPDNPMKDWNTQNYSEVDIKNQMVYVYKDGKLAYSSICVTGLYSDPERRTKLGCYFIKEKKEDYVLTGADYETPTKYWVRIMWTGTGYHYLGRSDWGRWTPQIYLSRGSHGCVNLQLEDAKAIYNLVGYRDPVFIYEG